MIKEVKYTKGFSRRLLQKREAMNFPRDVIFELTYRCNLRCRHCYVTSTAGKKELSTNEVKTIFDQLVELWCFHLTLTGGEPLLRKDILALIDYARRKGLYIHLFTNATLITPPVADKLSELQLTSVEISFHSLKKERFDWFARKKGSYDRVRQAIELLQERKVKLALKINITKINFDEIKQLKGFVKDLQAIPEWATIIMPQSSGGKGNFSLRLNPDEVLEANKILAEPKKEKEAVSTKEMHGDKNTEKRLPRNRLFHCGAGKKTFSITPFGEMKPCLGFPYAAYFILTGSLERGWKMIGDYIESFKPSRKYQCFGCKVKDFCSSCPAKAELECGDMNCCPDYYRRIAELAAQKETYCRI